MTLRAAAVALLAAWDGQKSILGPLEQLRRAVAADDQVESKRQAELARLREIAKKVGRPA